MYELAYQSYVKQQKRATKRAWNKAFYKANHPHVKKPFALKTLVDAGYNVVDIDPVFPENRVLRTQLNLGNNSIVRVDDPDWKVKVAKGIDATNPYSVVKHDGFCLFVYGKVLVKETQPNRFLNSSGYITTAMNDTVVPWTDLGLQDLALKRLKAKITSDIGVYQAVVPTVELRELRGSIVSMLASAEEMVGKSLSLIARRRLTGNSLFHFVQDSWLQWSFGISPLISDISDAGKAITGFINRQDHNVKLVGKSRLQRVDNSVSPGATFLSGSSLTLYSQIGETLFYKYAGAFDFKVKSSNDYSVGNIFSLKPESIVPVIYELTPYSWTLDYFTSVGDYLNDTFEVPSGSMKYLSLTRTHTREEYQTAKIIPNIGTYVVNEQCRYGLRFYKSVTRSKLLTLPHLSLRFKTLDEVGRNGLNKLANLLSLVKTPNPGRYVRR